jgi:general secretion pathway protein A
MPCTVLGSFVFSGLILVDANPMYTRYFGLTEKPFAIAPNPRYLFMSELHREAMAHLLYGISSEGCIILLTGDVGTGKTTVCRCLIDQLPSTTDIAMILNPKLTIADLFKTICEELKITIPAANPSIKTYIDQLNAYLLDAHSKGRNTALIIDEAQNLDVEILEQLRLLTNLETNTNKLLQIVLIGQPELQEILCDPTLSQINQRITTRYHLEPLQTVDVTTYIHHRLAIAGGNSRNILFSKQAIQYVAKVSKGIPRVINVLCDHALLGAYANNSDHVSLKIMKNAVRELAAITSPKLYPTKTLAVTLALFLLIIGVPLGLYFIDSRDNIALLRNNVALLNPFTDKNTTMHSQASTPSPRFASQKTQQGPETNIQHSPADKE